MNRYQVVACKSYADPVREFVVEASSWESAALKAERANPIVKSVKMIRPTYEATAHNGHRLVYPIIGYYEDGTPKSDSAEAWHSDNCPCITAHESGEWY